MKLGQIELVGVEGVGFDGVAAGGQVAGVDFLDTSGRVRLRTSLKFSWFSKSAGVRFARWICVPMPPSKIMIRFCRKERNGESAGFMGWVNRRAGPVR